MPSRKASNLQRMSSASRGSDGGSRVTGVLDEGVVPRAQRAGFFGSRERFFCAAGAIFFKFYHIFMDFDGFFACFAELSLHTHSRGEP